jgi:hypothetical protein
MTLTHTVTGKDGDGCQMEGKKIIRSKELFRLAVCTYITFCSKSMPVLLTSAGNVLMVYRDYRD